jgi:hypothetical protein
MDKTLTTSIALMAISGISFLAYKHPKGYNKLYPFILGFLFATLAVMLSWDFAIQTATVKLTPFISPDKVDQAIKSSYSLLIASGSLSAFCTGLMLYMSFLLFLPDIIEHGHDKKPEQESLKTK